MQMTWFYILKVIKTPPKIWLFNKFSEITGYINQYTKVILFLYSNKLSEKENPIYRSIINNELLGNKCISKKIKAVWDIVKEIKVDKNYWIGVPYSWIGRINIVKMSNSSYKFSAFPIKIPVSFCTIIEETILNL